MPHKGSPTYISWKLFPAKEFDIEDKGGVWWNKTRESSATICIVSTTGKLGTLTSAHLSDTFVPALNLHGLVMVSVLITYLDNLALSKNEFKWLATITGRVEFISIGKGTSVMN